MRKQLFAVGLFGTIVFMVVGAFFKMSHYPGASIIMFSGYGLSLLFIITGIVDVIKRSAIGPVFKVLWILGFLLGSWLVGLVYYVTQLAKDT